MASLISASKRQENLALAEENMAKAQKQVKKTFTRWKPDWEGAARYYREAVKAYKMSGDHAGTIQALRESAIAHKEIDSIHTAAADLEAAASLTRDERNDPVGASELFKQSGDLYKAHGAAWDKAGQMYVKAAECIGDSDVEAGVALMKEACALFEDEARGMFHDATFKKAACFCVSRGKFGSARSLLARQIKIQQRHMNPFEADLYKNCLTIVVLWMHSGDFPKAAEELQKFEGIERFARSEECLAANELVCAWEDSNQEAWDTCLKKQVFKYLINPVAVIARKLKMPAGGRGAAEDDDEEEKAPGGAGAGSGPEGQPRGTTTTTGTIAEGADGETDGTTAASSSAAAAAPAPKKKSRVKKIQLDEEDEIDLR